MILDGKWVGSGNGKMDVGRHIVKTVMDKIAKSFKLSLKSLNYYSALVTSLIKKFYISPN